jgi:beta-galactosidase
MKQIDALVKLSRNHPSVFLYGMFNEEPWQESVRGKRIAGKMRARVKALDDTRAVTAAQNGGMLMRENASDSLDVIGVNYNLASYEECHRRSPDKVILGTENSVMFATRGMYATDREKQVFADNGYEKPGDFSEPIFETMECVEKYPFVAGCFNWSGFDHRGEPNPYEYPSVYSHWGLTDTCGFDKNISYLLRAWYLEKPYVRLSQGWNFAEGEVVRVSAFTNCETAELFLNGKSLGEKTVERRRAEWEVPFTAGVLRVVVQKEGIQVCDEIKTAGKAVRLVCEDVTPETAQKTSKIVNVSVVDEGGTLVHDCNQTVYFTLAKGKVLGVGNGNPNGHQADCANFVPLFNSRAQVIVDGETCGLTISCDGLESVTLWGDEQ